MIFPELVLRRCNTVASNDIYVANILLSYLAALRADCSKLELLYEMGQESLKPSSLITQSPLGSSIRRVETRSSRGRALRNG